MCKMSTLCFSIGTEEDVRARETLEKNLKWERWSEKEEETLKNKIKWERGRGE
jgi:hypothetical protein